MYAIVKDIFLKTQDGIKIAIDHCRSGHDSVLIIAHGWFMTKDSKYYQNLMSAFRRHFDIINFDFRGHGNSSGFYTFTSKEPRDLKTVVNYAKKYYSKIYIMGFSLGAAVSLLHAAAEKDVDKIIAVSAPYSFNKIENHMWKKEAWEQSFKKFEFRRWITIRPSIFPHKKIRPVDVMDKLNVPTLFLAGAKDVTIRPWHSMSLYKNAKCPKKFELFANSCHAEDLFYQEQNKFIKTCCNFLLGEKNQPSTNPFCSSVWSANIAEKLSEARKALAFVDKDEIVDDLFCKYDSMEEALADSLGLNV